MLMYTIKYDMLILTCANHYGNHQQQSRKKSQKTRHTGYVKLRAQSIIPLHSLTLIALLIQANLLWSYVFNNCHNNVKTIGRQTAN